MTHDAQPRPQQSRTPSAPSSPESRLEDAAEFNGLNPNQRSAWQRAEKLSTDGVVRLADTTKETVAPRPFTAAGTLALILAIIGFFGNQISSDLGGGLLSVWCMLVAIGLAAATLVAVVIYELRHLRRRINRMVLIPMFAVFGLALLTALRVVIG